MVTGITGSPIVVPTKWWDDHSGNVFMRNVHRILPREGHFIELGAGRGKSAGKGGIESLLRVSGQGRRVTGVDVDPVVLQNKIVDDAYLWDGTSRIDMPDSSIDVVYSLATFEHVDEAEHTAAELSRLLKPGGWLCAWTPNKWGYGAMAARMVPNAWHKPILKIVSPHRHSIDTFPTRYRLNTIRDLNRLFPGFDDYSYVYAGFPAYTRGIKVFNAVVQGWETVFPGNTLHVFKQKRSS